MVAKKVHGIQIFMYETCKITATSKDGKARARFTGVKWNLREMTKYNGKSIDFDGEEIQVFDGSRVIYKVALAAIPSYFEKLEDKYHPTEWGVI